MFVLYSLFAFFFFFFFPLFVFYLRHFLGASDGFAILLLLLLYLHLFLRFLFLLSKKMIAVVLMTFFETLLVPFLKEYNRFLVVFGRVVHLLTPLCRHKACFQ